MNLENYEKDKAEMEADLDVLEDSYSDPKNVDSESSKQIISNNTLLSTHCL